MNMKFSVQQKGNKAPISKCNGIVIVDKKCGCHFIASH